MADNTASTKAMRLGAALRSAREDRGISLSQFAPQVELSKSQLSRIENGHTLPKEHELGRILSRLEVKGDRYDEIVGLLDGADATSWVATTLADQAVQHAAFIDFEAKAGTITEVAPNLLPGLTQIRAYVSAIMSSGSTVPPEEIGTRVATRLGRRDVISPEERPDPARFVAFLGKAAITQVIGDTEGMIQQLAHLLKISAWENVEIRVMSTVGWHPGLESAFTLIDPREPQGTPIVFLENRRSGQILHIEEDIAAYRDAVTLIMQAAMSREESAELIADVIKGMRTG
ncbi:helix-turn-helix domain-containing protein [Amycolatopsis sp. H20-H5]|uniref:helix-turn-helix domain-containing protein n=1 Tax=Amycolatopsis sp. H20-H5 TaxID=3046309 RepID=UPI002DB69565|nr:helix-turn-helix transcriptional regulator [Amycolatopsis sp. H20-H5]MEC3979218.1 helix-turn-helix transcriptional regulator [Amycolatopsis sp. H20-H5]